MPHVKLTGRLVKCLTTPVMAVVFMLGTGLALTACQSQPSGAHSAAIIKAGTMRGNPASLVAKPAASGASITDTVWQLVSLNSKVPQQFINQPYLFFKTLPGTQTGTLTGSTGCNLIQGQFTLGAGNRLELNASAGHDSCSEALAQEADIMQALSRVNSYQLKDDRLYVYDPQGIILLIARLTAGKL